MTPSAGRSGASTARTRPGRGRGGNGQSTVELALVLPFVVLLALALVQIGLVVRDQLLVVHAARDAARQAAVAGDRAQIAAAARRATALDPGRIDVDVGPRGGTGSTVQVTVHYRSPTAVPLVGRLVHDVDLEASAAMRVEG